MLTHSAPPFDLLMALSKIEGLRVNPEPLGLISGRRQVKAFASAGLSTGSKP
jgi:hypothetical protein